MDNIDMLKVPLENVCQDGSATYYVWQCKDKI